MTPAAAAEILAARDPVLAGLIAAAGPMRIGRRGTASHFAALVEAIVYQQLAGAAASAIHGRLVAALDGNVEPEALLSLVGRDTPGGRPVDQQGPLAARPGDEGRSTGRSCWRRAACPACRTRRSSLSLSTVRGIGPWTAHMFLIFRLRRLDVWPVGDFGVRQGYGLAWKVPAPTARELEPLGEPVPPLPHGGRLVLLAGGRALRGRCRQRPDPLTVAPPPGVGVSHRGIAR